MGLRPARCSREVKGMSWARISKKKPKKSYVRGAPDSQVKIFHMGTRGAYDTEFDVVADYGVQVRDNALEAARQAANKLLEKRLLTAYELMLHVYPHNVIRENKMILGAGADRLQKGMRHAFGRPQDRAARIGSGMTVFSLRISKQNADVAVEALRRAKGKMPGHYSVVVKSLA